VSSSASAPQDVAGVTVGEAEADGAPAPGDRPPRKHRGLRGLLPAPIWQVGRLLLLALIVEYLVVPQLAGPRKVAHLLTQVNPLLLLAGVGLEGAALVCYAQLTRTVLPSRHTLNLLTVLRIQFATLSVSHCAPGGSATGTALGYRLMTQVGVARSDVGFALAMQGIGSAVVLNLILWVALVVSIPVWGFSAVYLVAAAVGMVLLAAAGLLLFLFTRGQQRVGAALERLAGRLPFVDGAALRGSFEQVAGRLQDLGRQRGLLARAALWASGNWLLDAGSLAVFVGAFGHWVNPDGLLVAYGLANVLAAIPLTPGGLGVIEATLTSVLVGFGTPRGVATLGVVGYRLVNFWLPIPLGGLAYLSLQVKTGGPTTERGDRLRRGLRRGRSVLGPRERPWLRRGSGP
jgi:putative heme transporter